MANSDNSIILFGKLRRFYNRIKALIDLLDERIEETEAQITDTADNVDTLSSDLDNVKEEIYGSTVEVYIKSIRYLGGGNYMGYDKNDVAIQPSNYPNLKVGSLIYLLNSFSVSGLTLNPGYYKMTTISTGGSNCYIFVSGTNIYTSNLTPVMVNTGSIRESTGLTNLFPQMTLVDKNRNGNSTQNRVSSYGDKSFYVKENDIIVFEVNNDNYAFYLWMFDDNFVALLNGWTSNGGWTATNKTYIITIPCDGYLGIAFKKSDDSTITISEVQALDITLKYAYNNTELTKKMATKESVGQENIFPYDEWKGTGCYNNGSYTYENNGVTLARVSGRDEASTYFNPFNTGVEYIFPKDAVVVVESGKTIVFEWECATAEQNETTLIFWKSSDGSKVSQITVDGNAEKIIAVVPENADWLTWQFINYSKTAVSFKNIKMYRALDNTELTKAQKSNDILLVENAKKNFIVPPHEPGYTVTTNGITFTVNSDYSVSVSGTASGDTSYKLMQGSKVYELVKNNDMILSGCTGGNDVSGYTLEYSNDVDASIYCNNGDAKITAYPANYWNQRINILVRNGATVNTTIHPMIRPAGTSSDYVPYMMSNMELTEYVQDIYVEPDGNLTDPIIGAYKIRNKIYVEGYAECPFGWLTNYTLFDLYTDNKFAYGGALKAYWVDSNGAHYGPTRLTIVNYGNGQIRIRPSEDIVATSKVYINGVIILN